MKSSKRHVVFLIVNFFFLQLRKQIETGKKGKFSEEIFTMGPNVQNISHCRFCFSQKSVNVNFIYLWSPFIDTIPVKDLHLLDCNIYLML